MGQIVSLREKTLSNANLVVPRHIKKEKVYFWLTSIAQKGRCLNSLLTSNVRTIWDSDYGNHKSAIVIVFDLYKGHRGVIFQ